MRAELTERVALHAIRLVIHLQALLVIYRPTYKKTKRTPDTFTIDLKPHESDEDDTYHVDRRYRGPSHAQLKSKLYLTQRHPA
jgi:hypothetical protein